MVNIKEQGLGTQAFEDAVTINSESIPPGKLKIEQAEMVETKTGFSAGEKKLILKLRGEDKVLYAYWPNKTANSEIAAKHSDETDKWIGKEIELTAENVMVKGQKKKMIVIKA